MKDIARHLRYQQRKVLSEARKKQQARASMAPEELNGAVATETPAPLSHKFDPNHRKPRLLKRIMWH